MTTATKKITLSTVKSFIKKNEGKLFINVKSSFDGMVDGCTDRKDGFKPAETSSKVNSHYTLGISGAWFVGQSRDYFEPYEDATYTGIKVSNSCGRFILATVK